LENLSEVAVHIDVIETREQFEQLEANWNAVYDADPDAQFFLSWKWLSGWLRQIASPWVILAARKAAGKDAPYVAFLPLRIQFKVTDARFHNELTMAGNFAADYTGILCEPGLDHLVIPALARHLKQMNWARLNLENIRIPEARYRLLAAHFSKAKFDVQEISRVGKVDGIDNNICPFAPLPGDWNVYLDRLSANTRQKIRRLLKLVDTGSEYRITLATDKTIDRDLDTLLRFWDIKWRPRKGEVVDKLVRSNRIMLTTSFKAGLLYLPTLWQGDRPLAALATLIDERKRTFLFYMAGRDESFEGLSSGMALHAHSIRHAIANGVAEYDFLRGNEPYKYSFGVEVRRIRCVAIGTRNGLNLSGKLDRRTIADALKESTELHQAGKLVQAERGYRQILEVEAGNADAIHRLGQLHSTRGQRAAAKRLFKTLTEIRPETHKSWLCLAQACEALGQFREAANAYREVIKLRPDLPEAFAGLGKALVKLDRIREFDVAMAAVLEQSEPPSKASERRGNGNRYHLEAVTAS
jgi:CelD/BcsL family acetyltransferase involved in cellulose biosynthesis